MPRSALYTTYTYLGFCRQNTAAEDLVDLHSRSNATPCSRLARSAIYHIRYYTLYGCIYSLYAPHVVISRDLPFINMYTHISTYMHTYTHTHTHTRTHTHIHTHLEPSNRQPAVHTRAQTHTHTHTHIHTSRAFQ